MYSDGSTTPRKVSQAFHGDGVDFRLVYFGLDHQWLAHLLVAPLITIDDVVEEARENTEKAEITEQMESCPEPPETFHLFRYFRLFRILSSWLPLLHRFQ